MRAPWFAARLAFEGLSALAFAVVEGSIERFAISCVG
jgi:hypothetical protein